MQNKSGFPLPCAWACSFAKRKFFLNTSNQSIGAIEKNRYVVSDRSPIAVSSKIFKVLEKMGPFPYNFAFLLGRKMIRSILFALFCSVLFCEEEHSFVGKHFVASYLDCDRRAMGDLEGLIQAQHQAVQASGATILDWAKYVFPPNGLTIVYLLSESHASLHTYPEYGACFVDLFTCGDNCSAEKFDAALREYLQPKVVNARMFLRNEEVQEIPYLQR